MIDTDHIILEKDGEVARVWLNRPHKKNAADNNKATLILALSLPSRCTHHTSPPQEASITASHVVWVWADYENRACARLKI